MAKQEFKMEPEVHPMSDQQLAHQARLASEVFKLAIDATESFAEQDIGVDLAYLLGAIVEPSGIGKVDWSTAGGHDEPTVLLNTLRERLPASHPVWKHIQANPIRT